MVNVLLSTYNSEKFLRTQVDSILHQEGVDVRLTVRDDGSTDSTLDLLADYASRHGNVEYYTDGENLRSAKSFMRLLENASEAAFYAFADHDDYWMPEKLAVAVEALEQYGDEPALYFCQTQLADKDLNKIPSVIINPRLTFGESLVYGFIGGCTMVMNRKLRDIVTSYRPDFIEMHDTWIYRIALGIGAKVVFDPVPHILYRQHSGNVIGQGQGRLYEWKARFDRLLHGKQVRHATAVELQKGFRLLMPKRNQELLSLFVEARHSLPKRLRLLFSPDYKCADPTTWRIFKAVLLINRY